MQAEHVSVYIARAPSDVYEFASDDAPVGGEADITQVAGVEIFEGCGW